MFSLKSLTLNTAHCIYDFRENVCSLPYTVIMNSQVYHRALAQARPVNGATLKDLLNREQKDKPNFLIKAKCRDRLCAWKFMVPQTPTWCENWTAVYNSSFQWGRQVRPTMSNTCIISGSSQECLQCNMSFSTQLAQPQLKNQQHPTHWVLQTLHCSTVITVLRVSRSCRNLLRSECNWKCQMKTVGYIWKF